MIDKSYVISSIYSDGLSNVTGKAGAWKATKHQYAKTLADSTTMGGDINFFYSMI